MISEKMMNLGKKSSVIREIFEYGKKRKSEIGAENVFDFSLGNPSVPAPAEVTEIMKEFLEKRGENPPRYETVKTGKDHTPMFYTTVYALGESAKGEGKSKKEAESLASARLLWELTKLKKNK